MFKKVFLAMALVSAGALPAFAQGAACKAPAAPALPDPNSATLAQMQAMLGGAGPFMAASDTYQQCIVNDLAAQKAAATKDKPFDPAIEQAAMARVEANQTDKQKFGDGANAALVAFKTKHNCTTKKLAECTS